MGKKYGLILPATLLTAGGLMTWGFLRSANIAVLNPKGYIASEQKELIIITTLLMLTVVIPVFILTFFIVWKYRETNTRSVYTPTWDHDKRLETIWWTIPFIIISILALIIWRSSHDLDPYRPISYPSKPITIQVIALQWKWLFIYPEQNIATVNFIQFPQRTPITLEITADAPINSLWIPQLGGQIYAMPGMKTKLQMLANETGDYSGSSANLSGEGFAGMKFIARSSSQDEYYNWVQSVKRSSMTLDSDNYGALSKPSKKNAYAFYTLTDKELYNKVLMKYKPARSVKSDEYQNSSHNMSRD